MKESIDKDIEDIIKQLEIIASDPNLMIVSEQVWNFETESKLQRKGV